MKKISVTLFSILLCLVAKAQSNGDLLEIYQKQLQEQQKQLNDLQVQINKIKEEKDNIKPVQKKEEEKIFKPSGKVFAQVFMDYMNNLTHTSDRRQGYDISRSRLGYDYQMTPEWSARVMIDGTPDGILAQTGKNNSQSLKGPAMANVYVKYASSKMEFTAGMFTTPHIAIPLSFWQNRYIAKDYTVENKMVKGIDIGVDGVYKFSPYFEIEGAILKGEGNKTISKSNMMQYMIAANIKPTQSLFIRPLFDIKTGENLHQKDRMFSAVFVGYKDKTFSSGIQLAKVFNDGKNEINTYGYSIFTNGKLTDNLKLFGRFDVYETSQSEASYSGYDPYKDDGWFNGHTNMAIFGLEYQVIKNLKVAPNFIYKTYKKASQGQHDLHSNTIAVSLELKI